MYAMKRHSANRRKKIIFFSRGTGRVFDRAHIMAMQRLKYSIIFYTSIQTNNWIRWSICTTRAKRQQFFFSIGLIYLMVCILVWDCGQRSHCTLNQPMKHAIIIIINIDRCIEVRRWRQRLTLALHSIQKRTRKSTCERHQTTQCIYCTRIEL